MALVTSTEMFKKAYAGGYAIGAFNVNNMEIVQGITEACGELKAPVILQVSKGARAYANHTYLVKLVEAAVIENPDIPIVLHLDHGPDFETCKSCIDGGFTSVMIDGSSHSFEDNIALTRKVVEYAHDHGVVVEGELGTLAGIEDEVSHAVGSYTRPEEVEEFVTKTGVDSLAIAIGTSHGAYKFTKPPTGDTLSIQRIKEIHARIPDTHLVMHGSSSVPQDWLAIINEYGGEIKETYGVPVEEIVEGIKYGVRKVNIDTDLRLASTGAIRRFLAQNPSEFDPRKYFSKTVEAMRDICIARYEAFGTAGNASKIKPISLEGMFQRYARGELDPKVN